MPLDAERFQFSYIDALYHLRHELIHEVLPDNFDLCLAFDVKLNVVHHGSQNEVIRPREIFQTSEHGGEDTGICIMAGRVMEFEVHILEYKPGS